MKLLTIALISFSAHVATAGVGAFDSNWHCRQAFSDRDHGISAIVSRDHIRIMRQSIGDPRFETFSYNKGTILTFKEIYTGPSIYLSIDKSQLSFSGQASAILRILTGAHWETIALRCEGTTTY